MKFDSISEALETMGNWFAKSTCVLFGRDSLTTGLRHKGSGTCVSIQGLRVIITANHVLGDNPKESIFVPIWSKTLNHPVQLVGTCLVSSSSATLMAEKDPIDIAYFILSPESYDQLKGCYSFITYPLIHSEHEIRDDYKYYLTGYPEGKYISKRTSKKLTLIHYHTSLADNGGYKRGITKKTHIVVSRKKKTHHPETGQKMISPKFDGMSGGGLWVVKEDFTVIGDNGNIQLIGVFISVYKGYYICTRLDQVLSFMRGNRFHVDLNYKYDH